MNKKIQSLLFMTLCLFSSAQPTISIATLPHLTTTSFENIQKFIQEYPLLAVLAIILSIFGYKNFPKKTITDLVNTPQQTSTVTYDHTEKSLRHFVNGNEYKIHYDVENFSVSPNKKILCINQSIYQVPINLIATQTINKKAIDLNNPILTTITSFFDMQSGELIKEYTNLLNYQYNTQEDQILVLTYQEPSFITSVINKSSLLACLHDTQVGLHYSLLHIPSKKNILPQENSKTAFFDAGKLIIIDSQGDHHTFAPHLPKTFLDVAKMLKEPCYYVKEEKPQTIKSPYAICHRDNITKKYSITLNNAQNATPYENIKTYHFLGNNHLLLTYTNTKASLLGALCPTEEEMIHKPLQAAQTMLQKLPLAIKNTLNGTQRTDIIDITSGQIIKLSDNESITMCSCNPDQNRFVIIQNNGNYISFDTLNNSFDLYDQPHTLTPTLQNQLSVANAQSQACALKQQNSAQQINNPHISAPINAKVKYNASKKTLLINFINDQKQQTFNNVISYNFSPNKKYILINQISDSTPLIQIIGQVLWQKIDGKETLKLLLKQVIVTTIMDLTSGIIKKSFKDITAFSFHDADNKICIYYPRETLVHATGYDHKELHYQTYDIDTSIVTNIDQENSPFNNITYTYNELTKNYDFFLKDTNSTLKKWPDISTYQIIGNYIFLIQEIDETTFDEVVSQFRDIFTNKHINVIDALFSILDKTQTTSFLINKETGEEISQFENVIMSTSYDDQSFLLAQRKEKTVNYSIFNVTTEKTTALENADAIYCNHLIASSPEASYNDFTYISTYLTSADFLDAKKNTPSPLATLIEKGIRGFILPLYDFTGFRTKTNKIEGTDSPTLCICDGPAVQMKYSIYQSLSSVLPRLLAIMKDEKYKNDIFTIILENHSNAENSSSIISKEIENSLDPKNTECNLLLLATNKTKTNQWPTIGKLRKKDRRLIIFQNNKNNQNHDTTSVVHPIENDNPHYQFLHENALNNPHLLSLLH